jgi:hypothetical protein
MFTVVPAGDVTVGVDGVEDWVRVGLRRGCEHVDLAVSGNASQKLLQMRPLIHLELSRLLLLLLVISGDIDKEGSGRAGESRLVVKICLIFGNACCHWLAIYQSLVQIDNDDVVTLLKVFQMAESVATRKTALCRLHHLRSIQHFPRLLL